MIKFCPKCHREAYRIERSNGNIKITQGGSTVFNLNNKSTVSMNISCPNGHPVKLEIKPEEAKVGTS